MEEKNHRQLFTNVSLNEYKQELYRTYSEAKAKLGLFDMVSSLNVTLLLQKYTVLHSPHVNTIADRAWIYHACSCCDNSELLVSPYSMVGETKIFSNPPMIQVGERNKDGYGDVPFPNWEQDLKGFGFSFKVIDAVRGYFAANPPMEFCKDPEVFMETKSE